MKVGRILRSLAVLATATLLLSVTLNSATATVFTPGGDMDNSGPDQPNKRTKGGDGGGGTTPFTSTNQFAELADGENYSLTGKIVSWKGNFYLEVDLKEHSWLATAKRCSFPYYPLDVTASSYWKQFENLRVKLVAEAKGVVSHERMRHVYTIMLSPLVAPEVLK